MSEKDVTSRSRWYHRQGEEFVGPIGTEDFLELVRRGIIGPQTLIFLEGSLQWISAEQIDGLTFPASSPNHCPEPESVRSTLTIAPGRNQEMQQLFVDCVNRQISSQPRPRRVAVSPRKTPNRLGRAALGAISDVTATVANLTSQTLDWLGRLFLRIVCSRIMWVSVVLILTGLLIPRLSVSFVTQRQAAARLQSLFEQYLAFHTSDEDPEVQKEFDLYLLEELDEMVPQLQKHANSSDPTSMSLLWIARDYFPQLISDDSKFHAPAEIKVRTHFVMVDRALSKPANSNAEWGPWITLIVVIDVLGACIAVFYYCKNR